MDLGTNGERAKQVIILHSNREAAMDICHRVGFLDYNAVDYLAKPSELQRNDVLAIITEPGINESLNRNDRRCIDALRETTPTLLLSNNIENDEVQPLTGAPYWSVEMPLKRARLAHLLEQANRYSGKQRRQRLTGSSAPILKVRSLIEQVAEFDTNVLISGESGTGKELVAQTIHDLSARSSKPFVPINCGAIPAELLESELFGHEKGAFTGAVSTRKGRFELADGGTLFLDEIGDMSLPMQVKLLRVLQERSFERVGSNETRACDVRIVAATHRDLAQAVIDGKFREDLFYRLNVFPIDMPPLRKRLDDLTPLLSELVLGYGEENGVKLRLKPCAIRSLAAHAWPGNVRELGNLVERLAILHPTGNVGIEDLPSKYQNGSNGGTDSEPNEAIGAQGIVLKEYLQSLEEALIQSALDRSEGVVAKAARLLSMRRTTLVEKLRN